MAIRIEDNLMTLEADSCIIAVAEQRPDGWQEVACRPRYVDRDQAITPLARTELRETRRGGDDPLVIALREELR
jgi:hypothetical protein